MLKEYLEMMRKDAGRVNPLFKFLGVEVVEISRERVELRLPFRREFIQGAGVIAGGIMAALADEAMAHVIIANLAEGETTTTIEMNLRFLKSVKSGEMKAVARVVKKGRKVITVAADVLDGKGQLLAQAGASFMVLELGGEGARKR
ncbi:MAG TPA: PaaI family thioesterase [bacterium]|nr:PaaI family thioesterase [bacterium]